MYMDYIFIHSSVDGQLDGSHFPAIVNTTAMNMADHNRMLSEYAQQVKPGQTVVLFLVFWGTSTLVSVMAAPV